MIRVSEHSWAFNLLVVGTPDQADSCVVRAELRAQHGEGMRERIFTESLWLETSEVRVFIYNCTRRPSPGRLSARSGTQVPIVPLPYQSLCSRLPLSAV